MSPVCGMSAAEGPRLGIEIDRISDAENVVGTDKRFWLNEMIEDATTIQ
jgi:hypothetical protein